MATRLERLEPVPPPRAAIRLFETQLPLLEDGITVERFTTARGYVFEKHTTPQNVVHWFRVVVINE